MAVLRYLGKIVCYLIAGVLAWVLTFSLVATGLEHGYGFDDVQCTFWASRVASAAKLLVVGYGFVVRDETRKS
ncbi:hypothetical protein GGR26_000463 [Lewinella marina]|uniref:Uncharacterized protein n=1 Tax=Neolewinella marina TaxID=438751 RepID=A0A2G0CJM1_9BACT|nr:hypothetical protein [Neolewinella marina]NJB84718.1 hypothetical protein [Neolewinella marina]PHL00121.1 hypothetical protein CGL56_03505 [Neolewinella marina]